MRFQIFTFKRKFVSTQKPGEKKFEWWRALVSGLITTIVSLLLATYILSGAFNESEVNSQDKDMTKEVKDLHFGPTASETKLVEISQRILPMAEVYCSIQNCVVTCSLIPAASNPGIVAAVFIESNYESHCPNKVMVEELIFENCRFSTNALSSDWFPSQSQLKKLSLKRCSLTNIHPGAFSTQSFRNLTSLAIIDGGISVLQKSLFDALINLEELVISNNAIRQADADLLAGTANALQIIQISNAIYSEDVLVNIIGKSPLPKVLLLSLTGNQMDTISADAFIGVPNAESVYLTNSGISSVKDGAFEPFSGSIRQLFISDNKISSLPSNIFRSIIKVNPNFRLALANNEWNCDCQLEWLKNLTSPNLRIVTDDPRCVTPESNAMLKFSEADFCGDQSSNESEIATGPTSVHTTTSIEEDLVTLTCTEDEESSITSGRRLRSTLELKFGVKFPEFSVQEEDSGSVYVSLRTTSSAHTLIWFDNDLENPSFDGGEVGCVTNVRKSLYLNNLRRGVSYTICLLDIFLHLTSPFNCISLHTKPDYNDRLWLANKDQVMIIGVLTVVLIFVCLTSVIGSYYVVRENPKLLKGSKRIIMVRHRAADAIVLPEGISIDSSKDFGPLPRDGSTPASSSHKGYVSPMNQRRLLSRKGSVASGASSRSSGNSYVSGIEPTSAQLMTWRIRRIKEIIYSDNPMDDDDSPPPLPPPRHKLIPSLSLNVDERRFSNYQNPMAMFASDLTMREEIDEERP